MWYQFVVGIDVFFDVGQVVIFDDVVELFGVVDQNVRLIVGQCIGY